ncbi:class I SAM-dependent methyltransferase [Candidatus Bathyarchaeota archaeon]|nr:class I SAM-dependent methyltransferase [Candidatus Bathyarchaeota archaeon]
MRLIKHIRISKMLVKEMATSNEKSDKHFPVWGHKFSTLFSNPKKYCSYVKNGQVVADLGCGPGFYTLALANCVGNEGKVYAVDSDEKVIQSLEKKVDKVGYHNIEIHASSASDLSFIEDGSVDFILANGLLCSVAPQQLELVVVEMKRILKPKGQAYLSAAKGWGSYMSEEKWNEILEGFRVERSGDPLIGDRWALVFKK